MITRIISFLLTVYHFLRPQPSLNQLQKVYITCLLQVLHFSRLFAVLDLLKKGMIPSLDAVQPGQLHFRLSGVCLDLQLSLIKTEEHTGTHME